MKIICRLLLLFHMLQLVVLQNEDYELKLAAVPQIDTTQMEQLSQMVIISWKKNTEGKPHKCETKTDAEFINRVIKTKQYPIVKLTLSEFEDLVEECDYISRITKRQADYKVISSSRNGGRRLSGNSNKTRNNARDELNTQSPTDEKSPTNGNRRNGTRVLYQNRTKTNRGIHAKQGNATRTVSHPQNDGSRNYSLVQNAQSRKRSRSFDDDSYDRVNKSETVKASNESGYFNKSKASPSLENRNNFTSVSPIESEEDSTEGYSGWDIIYPGTIWCGAGSKAETREQLGRYSDTDNCCRAHDLCNDTMAPGERKYNLTNDSKFTKLSCKCDEDFYNCLESVNSFVSNKIGNVYFNALRRECFAYDYPLSENCQTYRSFLKITCKEYAKNTEAQKIYRWVPAKTYKKLPIPGSLDINIPFT